MTKQKDQKAKAPCSLCSLYNVDVCCLQARVKTDRYSVLILHMHLCAAVALCQQCSPIHKADHQQSHSDQSSFVLWIRSFGVCCIVQNCSGYVEQWKSSSNDLGVSRHCPACFSAFTLWSIWRNFKFIANKGPFCDFYVECDTAKQISTQAVKSAWRSWSKNKNRNNTLNIPHCPALYCLNKE